MRKRKLYQMLSLLTPEDLNGFEAFLANRFFNGRKTLVSFFKHWRKVLLDEPDEQDYTVEEFLNGTGIHPRRMNKLCSALYSLLCQYLAVTELMHSEAAQQDLLVNAIENRSSNHAEAPRVLEKLQAQVEAQPESSDKLLQALKIRWKEAELATKSRETRSLWKEDFQDLHDRLNQYYQLQKLKLTSASANIKTIFNQGEHDPGLDFLTHLKKTGDHETLPPLARAYYLVSVMNLEAEGGEAFLELRDLLGTHAQAFEAEEARELYAYALNFCIRNSNRGHRDYLIHMGALYRQLLSNRLILVEDKLRPQHVKNIVALHCRLGEIEWVADFIRDYNHLIPAEDRALSVEYNEAVLTFHQGQYGSAIQRFKDLIPNLSRDVFYEVDARAYLWKSYFENLAHNTMEEMDEMYKLYDAFRLFIDRNEKISALHKQHYRNFIREFKRFMEILNREPVSVEDLHRLKAHVIGIDCTNKEWFLQKIDSYAAGNPT
ncbi:MAG: hypothetical protein AAF570_03570 [Bacteroidota bacterium]